MDGRRREGLKRYSFARHHAGAVLYEGGRMFLSDEAALKHGKYLSRLRRGQTFRVLAAGGRVVGDVAAQPHPAGVVDPPAIGVGDSIDLRFPDVATAARDAIGYIESALLSRDATEAIAALEYAGPHLQAAVTKLIELTPEDASATGPDEHELRADAAEVGGL